MTNTQIAKSITADFELDPPLSPATVKMLADTAPGRYDRAVSTLRVNYGEEMTSSIESAVLQRRDP